MAKATARIDPKILILFMVLGLLPLGVGSLILINGARESHLESSKEHLAELADNAQTSLNNYLQRMIVQVAALGTVSDVRQVVARANNQQFGESHQNLDQEWPNLDSNRSPVLRDILGNPASRFLRDYSQLVPSFLEIMVTDIHGRLVAATNKTTDYLQGDERWWSFAYRQGTGGHFLGDIHFDQSVGAYAFEIAEPIIDPVNNSCIGVVKVVVDAQELFGLINSVEVGRDGFASLVRNDGLVVVSRRSTVQNQETLPGFEEIRAAAANNRRAAQLTEGDRTYFVGLPSGRLQETYPELDWYLLVQASRDDAYGTFANIHIRFLYIVLFSILLVGVLTLIFSLILSRPVIETDPHLEKL